MFHVMFFFPEIGLYFPMFITAVCFLFLLKLRWPKNKSVYDLIWYFRFSVAMGTRAGGLSLARSVSGDVKRHGIQVLKS